LASIAGDLIPDADNTRSIGSSSKQWKYLYCKSNAYFNKCQFQAISGAGWNGNFPPTADDSFVLGLTSYAWSGLAVNHLQAGTSSGVISLASDIIPDVDVSTDLGDITKRFKALYIRELYNNGDGNGTIGTSISRYGNIYGVNIGGVYSINGSASNHLFIISNYGGIRLQPNNNAVYTRQPQLVVWPTNMAYGTNNLLGATVGTGADNLVTIGITQPTASQSVTVTSSNNATPSGTVIVTGFALNNSVVSEGIVISAGATVKGTYCFSKITSVLIPAGVTAADSISVGYGNILGLPNPIMLSTTNAVPFVWIANILKVVTTDYLVTQWGIDFSPMGNISANQITSFYFISDA